MSSPPCGLYNEKNSFEPNVDNSGVCEREREKRRSQTLFDVNYCAFKKSICGTLYLVVVSGIIIIVLERRWLGEIRRHKYDVTAHLLPFSWILKLFNSLDHFRIWDFYYCRRMETVLVWREMFT